MTRPKDERQRLILRALSPSGKVSAHQIESRLIARGLEVSRRTLERDLEELVEAGVACADYAKPRGYKRAANAPVRLSRRIDPEEAVVLRLAEDNLSRLLPSTFGAIFGELFDAARAASFDPRDMPSAAKAPLARWPTRVRVVADWLVRGVPSVGLHVKEAVSEALLTARKLTLEYKARGRNGATHHAADPLALLQRGSTLYLLATLDGHDDARLLAMHRIQRASVLDAESHAPEGFDLDRWLVEGGMDAGAIGQIQLCLAVDSDAAFALEESPLAEGQVLTTLPDGRRLLRADLLWADQLTWWILGMAETVEVIEPVELRDLIRDRLRAAATQYEK